MGHIIILRTAQSCSRPCRLSGSNSATGQLIAGAGQGLLQGMAAKDKAKGDLKLQEQQQAYYRANYSTGTRGLLVGNKEWNDAQPWNQPTSVETASPDPIIETVAPVTLSPRYIFDPKLGRIVPQGEASATA